MIRKIAKGTAFGTTLIFAGILAITIGQRLGMDAMTLIVGGIFGVAISISTSIMFVLIERRLQALERGRIHKEQGQPPAVIVEREGTANFPRGDGEGHFCYPYPRRPHERG